MSPSSREPQFCRLGIRGSCLCSAGNAVVVLSVVNSVGDGWKKGRRSAGSDLWRIVSARVSQAVSRDLLGTVLPLVGWVTQLTNSRWEGLQQMNDLRLWFLLLFISAFLCSVPHKV